MPTMLVTRAYNTELDLNDRQVTACKRHAGAARFAYNWGLARKREAYEATGKTPSAIDLHRAVTRKPKGSHNRKKAARTLGKAYRTVSHQRANTLHQVTTMLAKTKAVIVIEDLNVAGMLKNHRLAQAIADVGFAEFRRQLLYKAEWYGSRMVLASRWEPSSETCSACGWYDADLTLADRTFRCQNAGCGHILDRDLNAAINVSKLAGSSPESQNACREASAGRGGELR